MMAKPVNAKRRKTEVSGVQWLSLIIVAIFVAIPLYATALGGFKARGELRINPFGLPKSWNPENFVGILFDSALFQSLGNSLFIAVSTVFLSVGLASMTGFVFAHVKFYGRNFLINFMLLGLLFPAAAAVLPLFLKLRDLGLLDSHLGIILAQTAFSLSFSILLFHKFFKEIPEELIEAARMDNCGYVKTYFYITLPLSLPIIATVGVFAFVGSWNNFLLPLVTLNTPEKYTWPLGIMQFRGEFGTDWPKILAYLTLTILPAVAFFLAAQRYIVAGLTGGAVKG